MTRIIALSLALIGAAAAAGCSDSTDGTPAATANTAQERLATPTGDQPSTTSAVDRDPTPQSGKGGSDIDSNTQQN